MYRRIRILVLGFLALSLWQSSASAQDRMMFHGPPPGGMMMGDGPGMMFPLLLKKLDLTSEQDARIKEIMTAHRDTFHSLFKQLETAHDAMTDRFFTPGDLKATDLDSQSQNVKQLREQLMNEGLKVGVEIRNVLTPEQLTKAAQIKEKMRAMHQQMRSLMEDGN
jgi:Spy/CpxP family protein refolding chaperone